MYKNFVKRILDFMLSLIALIVLSPLLCLITIIGAIAMKGNPFFVQKRPGLINNKTGKEQIIGLLKFRSMTNAKDKDGKLKPDKERLNKYGRILRASSLDELLSLINILKGDMSIVGPRPLLPSYLQYYSEWERQRHAVRPGLTGLAQVSGRNNLTWEKRFEKDIEYVNNVSLQMDIHILILTVKKVFIREGIEYNSSETIMDYFNSREEKTIEKVRL